jgi:hypothetical protein
MCLQWPRPTTELEVQSFLGFANCYCRFIKGFSQIEAPMFNITRAKKSSCGARNTTRPLQL